jgi:hypothetical protein
MTKKVQGNSFFHFLIRSGNLPQETDDSLPLFFSAKVGQRESGIQRTILVNPEKLLDKRGNFQDNHNHSNFFDALSLNVIK